MGATQINRISICELLLNGTNVDPFLNQLVTGDGKWTINNNIKRKMSWCKSGDSVQTVNKPGLTSKKILVCGIGRKTFTSIPLGPLERCTGPKAARGSYVSTLSSRFNSQCLPLVPFYAGQNFYGTYDIYTYYFPGSDQSLNTEDDKIKFQLM